MYKNRSVSVVLPIFNEEDNIKSFINDILELGVVDKIIAVDNNSTDRSSFEIQKTKATYLFVPNLGYGSAIISGLKATKEDLVIMVEPDGTFRATDIEKLLAYSNDFEIVLGTRTTKELIWQDAFMPWWVRFGNIICAKLIEILFSSPSLSDVGCTFKLISKDALLQVLPRCKVYGSHFSPDFIIESLNAKKSIIEIPVNYDKRVGVSKITGGNTINTIRLGVKMFFHILKKFFVIRIFNKW